MCERMRENLNTPGDLNNFFKSNYDLDINPIMNQTPTAIIIATAPKGEIVYINDAVWEFRGETDAKMTGISIEEYINTWKEFYPDGRQYKGEEMPLARSLLTGEIVYGEEIIVELDDKTRKWAIAYSSPIYKDNEIVAAIVVFSDITNIIEQKTRLKELNDIKFKLLKTLAHDLKTPYNSLIGFSDLLLESIEQKKYEDAEKYAIIIKSIANQAFLTTNNLVEWIMANSEDIKPKMELHNISMFIEEAVREVKFLADKKSISINQYVSPFLDGCFDKNMIGSTLRNLLNNAIKYSNPNQHIDIRVEQTKSKLLFVIADHGTGIADNRLTDLFHYEKRKSRPGTEGEKGSGLGLTICKEMIGKHQGEIWVNSIEGKGSTFKFSIPVSPQSRISF